MFPLICAPSLRRQEVTLYPQDVGARASLFAPGEGARLL
jgi:hypothetical protein